MHGPLGPRATLLLLVVTFTESLSNVLIQRGLYFYTSSTFGFGATENLWLAFVQGATYAGGAFASHRLTERFGERRSGLAVLTLLGVFHAALALGATPFTVTLTFPLIGALQGVKWPIIESLLSGGRRPAELLRLTGRYNVTWALAVPVALALSGALLDRGAGALLFALPAALNGLGLALALGWPARPAALCADHPDSPDPATLTRYGSLVRSARWTMVASYTLLFLLAPLMPSLLARHGLDLRTSTLTAALLDLVRLGAFVVLGFNTRWQGRSLPLALTGVALPLGFFLVLLGPNLASVVLGEVLFGVAAGVAYHASLYYALLVKNASVAAGGAHEGLIGVGYALGPLAGLAGQAIATGSEQSIALMTTVAPLALAGLVGAVRPLLALWLRPSAPAQ